MRKKVLFISLVLVFLCQLIRAEYSHVKDGIYICPDNVNTPEEIMLKVKNDTISVYLNMWGIVIYDGPGPIVNFDGNIVAQCRLLPVGCGIYELRDSLPQEKIFNDIIIEQSMEGAKNETDSVTVDIDFPDFIKDRINFDVVIIPWQGEKTVNKDGTVSFKLNTSTEYFYLAVMPEGGEPISNIFGNQLGPLQYMYNKPIEVTGKNIKITIPGVEAQGIFYNLNVAGEYLREIEPGVIKWRGRFYFYVPELTKKYLNNTHH